MPRRLHLIDGTYELFRAHYSKRPGHAAPDGRDVKACYGMASSLLALLGDEGEAVTHVAIAFDNPIRSFRNDMFDGYKTEAGVDPDLLAQFDLAEDTARALGITVWRMGEWEADDALATAAHRFRDAVDQVRLLTPDKDLGQCVVGDRVVQVDRVRDVLRDEGGVREKFGVAPASIPDWLALVGDDADGIPGVPRFGQKSAALLLSEYGRIEDIPEDPAHWGVKIRGAASLGAILSEHREAAMLYRRLATLVFDVPLEESLDDLAFTGVPRGAFSEWCDALGAGRLRDRPHRFRDD